MAASARSRKVCLSTDTRSEVTKGTEQMNPAIQYEIARMRTDEFHREAERERLIRQAAHDRNRGVEWTSMAARLRARLLGGAMRPVGRSVDAGA